MNNKKNKTLEANNMFTLLAIAVSQYIEMGNVQATVIVILTIGQDLALIGHMVKDKAVNNG